MGSPHRGGTVPPVFDYIVIGAGSAGCTLAARLTESGRHFTSSKTVIINPGTPRV